MVLISSGNIAHELSGNISIKIFKTSDFSQIKNRKKIVLLILI